MVCSNVYNTTAESAVKVSAHFTVREFQSQDGANIVLIHSTLPPILEKIRAKLGGAPIVINSGYRTVAHNKAVDGASASYHLYGLAADIVVPGYLPITVARVAQSVMGNTGGIGLYQSFVHIDARVNAYRFDKRSGTEKKVNSF